MSEKRFNYQNYLTNLQDKLQTKIKTDSNNSLEYQGLKTKLQNKEALNSEDLKTINDILLNSEEDNISEVYATRMSLYWEENKNRFRHQALILYNLLGLPTSNKINVGNLDLEDIDLSTLDALVSDCLNLSSKEELEEYYRSLEEYSTIAKIYFGSQVINNSLRAIESLKKDAIDPSFDITSLEELELLIEEINHHLATISYFNNIVKDLRAKALIEAQELANLSSKEHTLVLAATSYDNLKKLSYFEKDLKSIPEEAYNKIRSILTNFEIGSSNNYQIKSLAGHPGNFELKSNDQIRIVFSHLKDNYYLLKGVFLKKETWGQNDFITTCTRPEPKKDELKMAIFYSENRLEELLNDLETKARTGNRYQ